MARTLSVGESLVGDGNEVAHIDLLIGSKDGPVGQAFAASLVNQKEGHTALLAVVVGGLLVGEVDGVPAHEHALAAWLLEAGFVRSGLGYQIRRERRPQPPDALTPAAGAADRHA